jgi:hypothetical protein
MGERVVTPASRSKPSKQARQAPAPPVGQVEKFFATLFGPLLKSPRRLLMTSGAILILGLAVVGVSASDAGRWITLAGLLLMIFGVHTFGRLGPDDAPDARAE